MSSRLAEDPIQRSNPRFRFQQVDAHFFHPMIGGIIAGAIAMLPALTSQAATKDEYRAASITGLREQISFGRAKSMVKKVMAGTKDEKIVVVGRGEIMLVSQLLLAGKTNNDPELLGQARDLVLACNKAALDGYDTPEQNSLEQIGFSLRELGLALPELRKLDLLTGDDDLRAGETLKKAADFLLKFRPDPGDGNIMQRYALGVATVCSLFPDDPRVPQWKAWAQKPFLHLVHYPNQERLPGAVRRVLAKHGERWRFVPDTAPFQAARGVDISEDSSAYLASSIVSWMGIAPLIGRDEEIKTPQVRAFIDRFSSADDAHRHPARLRRCGLEWRARLVDRHLRVGGLGISRAEVSRGGGRHLSLSDRARPAGRRSERGRELRG